MVAQAAPKLHEAGNHRQLQYLCGCVLTTRLLYCCTAGIGPYITEPDTPVAAMWQQQYGSKDKKQHMKDMFELTTRVNALVRIATGNVNIAATTALQVSSTRP